MLLACWLHVGAEGHPLELNVPRKYHPDKNLEASKEEASRRFREVAEAYAALNQFLGA